jgi:hypothetical protein
MTKKVVTKARVRNSLHKKFKDFIDDEKIPEQINKSIEEHSVKKGRIIEFYPYLDTALVELSDSSKIEAYILHRCYGGVVDLFTPVGEQIISETKHEPCIIPRFYQNVLVAEIGAEEYVILGYFGLEKNMVGSFSPAEQGEYILRTMNDVFQAGLQISSNSVDIASNTGASFIEAGAGENKPIEYANSKNTYTKKEVYDKKEVDQLLKQIWDYIHEHIPDGDVNDG